MRARRLEKLLRAYGADPTRWPEGERYEGSESRHGLAYREEAVLDAALDRFLVLPPDPELEDRIVAHAIAQEQVRPGLPRRTLPDVPIAGWSERLGLGWPQLAALAAAAVLGLVVGWSDPWVAAPPPAAEEVVLLSMMDGLD